MRLLVLLLVIGLGAYLLREWFFQYDTNVLDSVETPTGLQDGIYAPIDAAGGAAEAIERGFGYQPE